MNLILLIGATLRLTRFVTTDTLGGWLIVEPAHRWAINAEGGYSELHNVDVDSDSITYTENLSLDPERGPRSKGVSGLECPFCVGTWIGFALIVSYLLARRSSVTLSLWRFVTGGLSLNYVTAHISAALDG